MNGLAGPLSGRVAMLAVVLLLGLVAVFGSPSSAFAQASLTGPSSGQAAAGVAEPGILSSLLQRIRAAQFRLQRDLAAGVRELKQSGSLLPALSLAFLAFLYGIFHAVGPGHGKVVISSYLLADASRLTRGIAISFLAAFVQALSAIALVGVLAMLLDLSRFETTGSVRYLEIASYVLVIGVGLWMLYGIVAGWRRRHRHHGHGHHGHGCGHGHGLPDLDRATGSGLGRVAAVVMAVGIRPCSGAVIILLFTLAHGVFAIGVGATFAMSVGTAITVSALAALTVMSRQFAMRLAGTNAKWAGRLHGGLSVAGAVAVLGFGTLLLVAAVGPQALA